MLLKGVVAGIAHYGNCIGVPTVGGAGSTPGLDAALIAAGLGGLGSRGFTFDDAGTTARPALTPQDDFRQYNYALLDLAMLVCGPKAPRCAPLAMRHPCRR